MAAYFLSRDLFPINPHQVDKARWLGGHAALLCGATPG
jgi:hypothetical protein